MSEEGCTLLVIEVKVRVGADWMSCMFTRPN